MDAEAFAFSLSFDDIGGGGSGGLSGPAASGSGLDPDITLEAARYQADRVAKARGLRREEVDELIDSHARRPGGVLTSEPVVNVLALNLALSESR